MEYGPLVDFAPGLGIAVCTIYCGSAPIKKLFSEPENIMTSKKVQQWAGLQIVKIFLGIPIVPGR